MRDLLTDWEQLFLKFIQEKNRITERFLNGDQYVLYGDFDVIKEINDLFAEYENIWEAWGLPKSALGRLALTRAKMVTRMYGEGSPEAQDALEKTRQFCLDKDLNMPPIFRKLLEDMERRAASSKPSGVGQDEGRTCGCSFDVWKCGAHLNVKCDCEHVGTIVTCDYHYEEWKDRYDIEILPDRFGKPLKRGTKASEDGKKPKDPAKSQKDQKTAPDASTSTKGDANEGVQK